MSHSKNGFTIVELLIVIVVIAILAAITVTVYNGIQNRAYDTAAKSDMRQFAQKIEVFRAEHSRFPHPSTTNDEEMISLGFRASPVYMVEPGAIRNFVYCTSADRQRYALVVKAKSGNAYYASSATGSSAQSFTGTYTNTTYAADLCVSLGLHASADHQRAGYRPRFDGWQQWTGLGTGIGPDD